jgi:ABC-type phosphate transport system permease subunit
MQKLAVGLDLADEAPVPRIRPRTKRHGDAIFRIIALSAALFVLISLGGVAFSMFWGGLPAFMAWRSSTVPNGIRSPRISAPWCPSSARWPHPPSP